MNASWAAALLAIAILAAVAAAYTAQGRVTCGPPRHVVEYQTLGGPNYRCVSTPTSPPAPAAAHTGR